MEQIDAEAVVAEDFDDLAESFAGSEPGDGVFDEDEECCGSHEDIEAHAVHVGLDTDTGFYTQAVSEPGSGKGAEETADIE